MPDHPLRPGDVRPQVLSELPDLLGTARVEGDPSVTVTGMTHDSRAVRPGDLYVARAGEHTHGIDHVDDALRNGAVAVLTDPASAARAAAAGARAVVVIDDPRAAMGAAAAWVYGSPARDLDVIGVTGTNGKTTTAYLLEAGLRAAGRRTGLIGTIETRIAGDAVPSARTTPEATDLHALFAVMRERGVDAVVMEVSSHALALGRVDGLTFDVAAFTNLSQDHLDFHHDMEDYFAAKASLFTPELSRRAVVMVDDAWGRRLGAQTPVPVTTLGRDDGDWRYEDGPDLGSDGGVVRLRAPDGGRHDVRCRLASRVNLANAALAYVTLLAGGVAGPAAREGIESVASVPGRMEPVQAGQPYLVFVDYAHTPDAVEAVLADARRLAGPGGRVLVVLGCGGDRDRAKRPAMGAAAARADLAVLTSDNPRSEDPDEILAEMRSGVPDGAEIVVEPDRRAAIERAVGAARSGDVLVVAGKGHEQGQETGGRTTPFDDRLVAREAVTGHRAGVS